MDSASQPCYCQDCMRDPARRGGWPNHATSAAGNWWQPVVDERRSFQTFLPPREELRVPDIVPATFHHSRPASSSASPYTQNTPTAPAMVQHTSMGTAGQGYPPTAHVEPAPQTQNVPAAQPQRAATSEESPTSGTSSQAPFPASISFVVEDVQVVRVEHGVVYVTQRIRINI